MSRPSRRSVLAATATTLATGGCVGMFDDGPDRETRDADGFPVAAHPEEWPLPNHDGQHSRRVPAAAPSGGDGLERSWRRSVEGYPEGLVAAGGQCFATVQEFQDSGEEVLRTLAVDSKSGDRLWNRATGPWPGGMSPFGIRAASRRRRGDVLDPRVPGRRKVDDRSRRGDRGATVVGPDRVRR